MFPEDGVLKVLGRLRALRHALVQIRDYGRRDGEPEGEAGLEGVARPDVADLRDVRLDDADAVSLDEPVPLPEHVFNAARSRADPLELEVEDG